MIINFHRTSQQAGVVKTKGRRKLKIDRKKLKPKKQQLVQTKSTSKISSEKEHEAFDDDESDKHDRNNANYDHEDPMLDTSFGPINVEDEVDFNDTDTTVAYEFGDIEKAAAAENYSLMNVDGTNDQDILEANNESQLPITDYNPIKSTSDKLTNFNYLPVEVQSVMSEERTKQECSNIDKYGIPKVENKKEKYSKKVRVSFSFVSFL